ncbi:class I SAM-dependent methyltransferase [Tychonema sp. LEGE 07199]|uniref:class I SAM-dependent methyltransferase n=1 Tax=unclassified Tychonema TaxID=2642144 RepID=UPI001880CD03|nr:MULTISPECIES: class I SAM-dependent methyltransferase [unclassified Tychonema]MBE9121050.1 class I SAM-dependent methyltransferase [Tychonema sp. LEGE 07199]MBE9133473.1 class I SAM-dependent methyltransferase [Tychonema sp. LEGE 07196]
MPNSNWKIRNKSVMFDAFATEYDFAATLQSKNDFFTKNLSTSKGAALDIGCGSGILAFELAKYYDNVVAVDISPKMLDIANQKRSAPNIEYIQMDASQLALDRKFDLIVSDTTFHHFSNVPATLSLIKKLLNQQGKIVFLDNISEVERPATISYILGAVRDFRPDCSKYGFRKASRLLKFRLSPSWLKHLASDRYLSEARFKKMYGRCFPGCYFVRLDCFMGVIWENL